MGSHRPRAEAFMITKQNESGEKGFVLKYFYEFYEL